jgi:hypothetical protein
MKISPQEIRIYMANMAISLGKSKFTGRNLKNHFFKGYQSPRIMTCREFSPTSKRGKISYEQKNIGFINKPN